MLKCGTLGVRAYLLIQRSFVHGPYYVTRGHIDLMGRMLQQETEVSRESCTCDARKRRLTRR